VPLLDSVVLYDITRPGVDTSIWQGWTRVNQRSRSRKEKQRTRKADAAPSSRGKAEYRSGDYVRYKFEFRQGWISSMQTCRSRWERIVPPVVSASFANGGRTIRSGGLATKRERDPSERCDRITRKAGGRRNHSERGNAARCPIAAKNTPRLGRSALERTAE